MKQKLKFLLFYLIWVAACLELILSFGKDYLPYGMVVGAVSFVVVIAFVCVGGETDSVIHVLLPPAIFMFLMAIVVSTIVSRSPWMLCSVGIQAIILWQAERGCEYERLYKS